jgi:single-strand DNA-binding protein
MQNIAEFQIIGRIGKIDAKDNVTYMSVAANYRRKVDEEWEDDTHWNNVTLFGKVAKRLGKMTKGDLVHVRGRVRQNRFEKDGETQFTVDLIADEIARLAKVGEGSEDDQH